MRTFLKHNLWSFLWALVIVLLTCLPGKVFPALPRFMDLLQPDKWVHGIMFGIYVFVQIRGFVLQDRFPFLHHNAVVITLLIGILLAMGTELAQKFFIPLRSGSPYDFLADVVGCLLGLLAAWKFVRINR
ncbi:MAG: VanZ family protein [Bacteroidales bacterium]|nr:VanZ family protein [Bacteroidales bacterium]